MKCYKCDWEGEEEQMVERPSGLFLYDYVIAEKIKMEVTRSNYHCPRCENILVSHRKVGGMVFDGA